MEEIVLMRPMCSSRKNLHYLQNFAARKYGLINYGRHITKVDK